MASAGSAAFAGHGKADAVRPGWQIDGIECCGRGLAIAKIPGISGTILNLRCHDDLIFVFAHRKGGIGLVATACLFEDYGLAFAATCEREDLLAVARFVFAQHFYFCRSCAIAIRRREIHPALSGVRAPGASGTDGQGLFTAFVGKIKHTWAYVQVASYRIAIEGNVVVCLSHGHPGIYRNVVSPCGQVFEQGSAGGLIAKFRTFAQTEAGFYKINGADGFSTNFTFDEGQLHVLASAKYVHFYKQPPWFVEFDFVDLVIALCFVNSRTTSVTPYVIPPVEGALVAEFVSAFYSNCLVAQIVKPAFYGKIETTPVVLAWPIDDQQIGTGFKSGNNLFFFWVVGIGISLSEAIFFKHLGVRSFGSANILDQK